MLSGFEPVDVQEIINVKFKRQRSSVFYDTPSYSRDAQRTLDFAYMIACEWKDSEIRTEHLLIALIALSCEGDDLAAVFSEMELTVGKIRNHFLAILGNKSISLSSPSPPPDRNLM
jgi:ATP-dependent Clp protease ATP-binding subunit ClpA